MAEQAFLTDKMTNSGWQDPMGLDAQTGLQRFMDKFHQPGVPSHTIITDPEYFVFLWFHNAIGNLIECPYTKGKGYKSRMHNMDFEAANKPFGSRIGIHGSGTNTDLGPKCLDLTPFVREATLPDIAPAGGEKILTLFGETTAGAFSPYASDGQKSITLQMLDTEYSILDAIFYPWMKDINSPWWYRPEHIYTEWATPYPMATLEVQRPRMRYKLNPEAGESRNVDGYVYYSYRFIGIKPISYGPFQVNAGGVSQLTRSLTLISDMCIVDTTNDAHITKDGTSNFGVRRGFIFADEPESDTDDTEPENDDEDEFPEDEYNGQSDDLDDTNDLIQDNEDDIEQQDNGDMPGEDEPEVDDNYYPNDYDEIEKEQFLNPDKEPSSSNGSDSPNEDVEDEALDNEEEDDENPGIVSKAIDAVKDVASKVATAVKNGVSAGVNAVKNGVSSVMSLFSSKSGSSSQASSGASGALASSASSTSSSSSSRSARNILTVREGDDEVNNDSVNEILKYTITEAINAQGLNIGTLTTTQALFSGTSGKESLYDMFNIQTKSLQKNNDLDSGFYKILYDSLVNSPQSDVAVFGIVLNYPSSSVDINHPTTEYSEVSSFTSLLAGVLDSGMSHAFSYVCQKSDYLNDIIGNTLTNMYSASSKTNSYEWSTGQINQLTSAMKQVRECADLTAKINESASTIESGIQEFGVVLEQVTKLNSLTELDLQKTLKRISQQRNGKPTPLELYVDLVVSSRYQS